jgi:hypothetical protein
MTSRLTPEESEMANFNQDALGALSERLDRLERENRHLRKESRRIKRGTYLAFFGLVLVVMVGADQGENC